LRAGEATCAQSRIALQRTLCEVVAQLGALPNDCSTFDIIKIQKDGQNGRSLDQKGIVRGVSAASQYEYAGKNTRKPSSSDKGRRQIGAGLKDLAAVLSAEGRFRCFLADNAKVHFEHCRELRTVQIDDGASSDIGTTS
jgi:hypothetical protein